MSYLVCLRTKDATPRKKKEVKAIPLADDVVKLQNYLKERDSNKFLSYKSQSQARKRYSKLGPN